MEDMEEFLDHSIKIEQTALDMIDKEVDRIIENNITDISIIEYLLDMLLGLILVDSSGVFNKLNDYYERVNKEYSLEYKLIYKEIKDVD